MHGFQAHLADRFDKVGEQQNAAHARLRQELTDGQKAAGEAVEGATRRFGDHQRERLEAMQHEQKAALDKVEGELKRLAQANTDEQAKARAALAEQLDKVRADSEARQKDLRETLDRQFDALRKENEAKLEKMRETVDEKLQGTLEKRLGESFQQVREQLDSVHKGLGEMQTLATGVGDLKRVLTNVKSRGGWGEVQLGALLEDMLTPEQFERNARCRPETLECVEYAVRLPGPTGEGRLLLPIDAKFPQEDYQRLLDAQDRGALDEVEAASKALERAVREQAKTLCAKYVHPPQTTNFAIMYLPTEGLFAEVIRRPGLMAELQSSCRVMVMGPTTLGAMLNSLQMGFRTLAIQKRSSEVWQVLAAAKAEFLKYGAVWEKLEKQLDTAKNTVSEAGRRTRAVERRLRDVETLEGPEAGAPPLLALATVEDEAA